MYAVSPIDDIIVLHPLRIWSIEKVGEAYRTIVGQPHSPAGNDDISVVHSWDSMESQVQL
jgi:hypothetical protein